MTRSVRLLGLITAAVLAAPAAMAGDIYKCVDGGGHVTLTDQACSTGATGYKLVQDDSPAPQRHVVPATELRRADWQRLPTVHVGRPPAATPVRLAGDVATLKAARRMLLLQDAKPRLAGLD